MPLSNISKHTRYYVEFFQNSIIASTRAVFERDILFFLANVIHCFLVAALFNVRTYLDIDLVRRFQAKLVLHFCGKSTNIMQYLPLSE